MSRADRLREADEAESASSRLRAWAGITPGSSGDLRVRDWLNSRGAVPATLFCAALAVYLIATLVLSFR